MTTEPEVGHGRIDVREIKAARLEAEACGMPFARQVLSMRRESIDKKSGECSEEIRYFLTSLDTHEATAKQLATLVRGHWSVENRNHWRRDATLWREDSCRLRNPRAALNFALLRNALLALIPPEFKPLAEAFEHYNRRPAAAIALLNSKNTPS